MSWTAIYARLCSYRVVFRNDIVPHLPPCSKRTDMHGQEVVSNTCKPGKFTPYHQGTEIWYPASMRPGSNYVECVGTPKGEDATCSNTFLFNYNHYELYTFDHRHYFTVQRDQLIGANTRMENNRVVVVLYSLLSSLLVVIVF
ncbi:hypothetical protein ANCDUO_14063 [Ancylostoma duodenale]|uniref:Uncharacterized protein n=1 Tax=Ancylostoma duodenale TaxID=51022 RepID=A0A0C2G471_9BILA|nr:hypothetical protein ANCDUO_14063 [Ancylostoma duodenale]